MSQADVIYSPKRVLCIGMGELEGGGIVMYGSVKKIPQFILIQLSEVSVRNIQ